jgi:hypothetical protein
VCGESYAAVVETGRYAERLSLPPEVSAESVCVAREREHTELYLHTGGSEP